MVKTMMSKQQKIDEFLNTLQNYVDIRYRINKETDYSNHSYVIKHINPEYHKIKKQLEDAINNLLT